MSMKAWKAANVLRVLNEAPQTTLRRSQLNSGVVRKLLKDGHAIASRGGVLTLTAAGRKAQQPPR